MTAVFNRVDFIHFAIENVIFSIVTSIIIIGQVYKDKNIINLENQLLSYLGKLSYGIYVYHPLIIYLLMKTRIIHHIDNEFVALISAFVLVTGVTVLVAHLSYYLVEKRFLNLKHRFSIVRSTNERENKST